MKYTYIKVDGSFPTDSMPSVTALLERGWSIYDKTVIDGRYIMFILCEYIDIDVGKASKSS